MNQNSMPDIVDKITKRGTPSIVWSHFGFPKVDGVVDMKKSICKICHAIVPYSGNTTNMHAHLDRNHWSVVSCVK